MDPARVAPGSKLGGACQRKSKLDGMVRVIIAAHIGQADPQAAAIPEQCPARWRWCRSHSLFLLP